MRRALGGRITIPGWQLSRDICHCSQPVKGCTPKPRGGGRQQPLARLGRSNASRGALDEANRKPFLKLAQALAEGGRGYPKLYCRFGEASLLDDRNKGIHLSKTGPPPQSCGAVPRG